MLPETLDIVDTLAASIVFDPSLTARDRSLMFAVSWYAGQHPPAAGQDTMVPDLPLRRDLGNLRRSDEAKEFGRYRRLEHATLRTDETLPDMMDGVLAPTVRSGMRRITIGGKRAWIVEPEIVRSFQPQPGDVVVGVPLEVLARARSRYTLALVLRLLAWGSGNHPPRWLRRDRGDHLLLRIPLDALRAELGAEATGAREFLRSDLQPAIDEIHQLTDLVVDVASYHAPSIRKPQGRILGFDVVVGKVERRVVPMPERTAAPISEVVAFRPRPGAAIMPFRPRPVPKLAAAPVEPEDDEFAPPPLPDGDYIPFSDENPF